MVGPKRAAVLQVRSASSAPAFGAASSTGACLGARGGISCITPCTLHAACSLGSSRPHASERERDREAERVVLIHCKADDMAPDLGDDDFDAKGLMPLDTPILKVSRYEMPRSIA